MKRYIHSSESEFIDIIPIEIEIEIPDAIYSSTDDINNQLFFDEKQELVMSLYDNLTKELKDDDLQYQNEKYFIDSFLRWNRFLRLAATG